jgi:hypothetical protein
MRREKGTVLNSQYGEDVYRLGADTKVGVSFAEEDGVGAVDDEDSWEWKTPTGFGGVVVAEACVVEGNVDEDGLIVAAEVVRYGVGDAKLLSESSSGIGEQRIGKAVLLESEAVLASGLGRNGDEESTTLAQIRVEVAPGFKFSDTVGIPTAAEEVDDERAEGEEVGGTDRFVGEGVFECEGWSLRPGFQDEVLDTSVEEIFGRLFGDRETFGLDECTGVLRDAVELVLERDVNSGSHNYIIAAVCLLSLELFSLWHETVVPDFWATALSWLVLVATLADFISLIRVTRRLKPCSRAVLLPGTVLVGSSPARMKPWPAPS